MFNNDRKIGLVEEIVHSLQYALASIRMPVLVKRQNDQLGLWFNRSVRLAPAIDRGPCPARALPVLYAANTGDGKCPQVP